MVAVCALVKRGSDGSCEDVRIGLTNMGSTALRASAAEQAPEGTEPPTDLNASADYKRHLARVLCRRALEEAAAAA